MSSQRRFLWTIVIAVLVIGTVLLVVWWQDRELQRGAVRLAEGDVAGALASVDRFLERHPEHTGALLLRARTLLAAGQAEQAAGIFQQVGAAHPDDLRAWARALMVLGQWTQASSVLEQRLTLDPADAETLESISICQFELGRYLSAVESARRLAELPGHEATGHLQLASIYYEWGYRSLANEHYATVLRYRADASGLRMEPAEIFLAYGDSMLAVGNARRALEILERSAQIVPSVDVSLRQARAWQVIGDCKRAGEILTAVLQRDSGLAHVREQLAEVTLQQGEPARALEWLEPLVQGDRISADAAYLLQRAYTALGEEAPAQQWQERTILLRAAQRRLAALQAQARANPQSPRARVIAAYRAAAAGHWSVAGPLLAALLRQSPESYDLPFVQALVEAVRTQGVLPPIESLPKTL